jgi:excisionase family DNA binding protein
LAEAECSTREAAEPKQTLYNQIGRGRGKCGLVCGFLDFYRIPELVGKAHHCCFLWVDHPGPCHFASPCRGNPPGVGWRPEHHRRVRPEDVKYTPEMLDPLRPANVLRRIYREVQGTALPRPRIVGDEEKWAYWFGENGRLRRNVDDDRDNFLVIRGPPGCGKSTLALRIAGSMYPGLDASNVKDHFAFSVAQFHQLVLRSEDTFLTLDEAAVGGLSIDWNRPEARALVETAQTMRYRHLTVALLIPNVDDLLASIRVRRAEWHIKCNHDPKGAAVVREKNWELDQPLRRGDLGLRTRWDWNPIHWEPFPDDDPLWVEYLRLKARADDRRTRLQLRELRGRERAREMVQERAAMPTLTVAQAASFLKASARSVRRWAEQGRLPAHRLPGGEHRFNLDDIVRFDSTYLAKPAKPAKADSRRGGAR